MCVGVAMNHDVTDQNADRIAPINPQGVSSAIVVCEHATHYIPSHFNGLGLSDAARESHIAWDPGAMAVAEKLSRKLDAMLIAGNVSRLVYDCNRPPDAPDAMPEKSEIYAVPGNQHLTPADKAARVTAYYTPFKNGLSAAILQKQAPVIVTVHSFTPTYHGKPRSVEIGVVHDSDARLAGAMLDCAADHTTLDVRRNQPYGPEHGVTHTLKEHALSGGHLNVMLEIRNDLIATTAQQKARADMLAAWIADAFGRTKVAGSVQCVA